MNIYDELREGVKRLEDEHKAFGGRILVFGPGDDLGNKKRRNLIRRLKRRGFEACTSEQLSKKAPSFLNAFQQKDIHWRLFDIILVFNYGYGVGQEVAGYAHDPEFRQRSFIVYPPEYDPAVSPSFGSNILRQYPNKRPVTNEEWVSCFASEVGMDYVVSRRGVEFELQRASANSLGEIT